MDDKARFNADRKRLKLLLDRKDVTGDDIRDALRAAFGSLPDEQRWAVDGACEALGDIRRAGNLTQLEVTAAIGMLLEGDFLAQGNSRLDIARESC